MSRDLLARASAYADAVTADLTAEDLRLATPCDGWDVGRVVLHLADVADGLVNLLDTGQLALPDPERTADPDPVGVLRACLSRLDARLSTAPHPERVDAAAEAGAIELTVHGWDIGIARDPEHATPPALAREVLDRAAARVTDEIRDPIFGPPVPVPDGAAPGERLAGFLGRRPGRRDASGEAGASAGSVAS